jgi:Putative prokaryotic signal transducing protein
MRELLRSNDLVYLSFVAHVLDEEGIAHLVFDGYTSAVEGSIGAIPRRVMVADEDVVKATRALGNASLTING